MFEDLLKTLNELGKTTISVPIEDDENGYIDKQCSSDECMFVFKVNSEDWVNKFDDDAVWCPMCRHEAPADHWYTEEQVEHAQNEAFEIAQSRMDEAMKVDARKFNRRQKRGSFVSMSMKISGTGPRKSQAIPAQAADAMKLEIDCDKCGARFAVIGSAYFCPCCGHNSVLRTYSDSLRKIHAKSANVDVVRTALLEVLGVDETELICRSQRETCLSDGVVAFQKYCEGLYDNYGVAPFNAFQRLDQGSQLWFSAIGKKYEDWLSSAEYNALKILFQKRHLLSHNEGIVDQQYLDRTGDNAFSLGQRIVIKESDINTLVNCLTKISDGLKFEFSAP